LAPASRGQKIGPPPQSLHGNSLYENPLCEPAAGWHASGAQSLATARAPGRDHLAAARGCHAGAETVPAFAHQFARLIGPLHGWLSPQAAGGWFKVTRLIREAGLARQCEARSRDERVNAGLK